LVDCWIISFLYFAPAVTHLSGISIFAAAALLIHRHRPYLFNLLPPPFQFSAATAAKSDCFFGLPFVWLIVRFLWLIVGLLG
jgi:hypothetical protein